MPSMNRPEVKIAVPLLTSPDRYWSPVRRAASRSAEKTSGGVAWKVNGCVLLPLTSSPLDRRRDTVAIVPQSLCERCERTRLSGLDLLSMTERINLEPERVLTARMGAGRIRPLMPR